MKGRYESEDRLFRLRKEIAERAQVVYDDWEQDEEGACDEYGCGGICDTIADEIVDVLDRAGIDARSQHDDSENHTSVLARLPDGIYGVDIPPSVYETGEWYVYKKRSGVVFDESDVIVEKIFDADEAEEIWSQE